MSGWEGPILTDSGGFQVFSLGAINEVTEQAATFRSHVDGAIIQLSPERSIEIQEALGSDVAMVLDHVIALPASPEAVIDATARSVRWAERCLQAATREDQARFAIVQGGLDAELRVQCASQLASMPFEGFAVGGLSVGEEPAEMYRITAATTPALPDAKPRYLMGVGRPIDLLESIARGIDLFDCVMPTRNGRNGLAFTDAGPLKLRNAVHREDTRPLQANCPCLACRHSRGYLRHLFVAGEMLGPILLSIHNLTYYQQLMKEARQAIRADRFTQYLAEKKAGWTPKRSPQDRADAL
jgi:queuine tRNA-ribosyltransferase